MSEAHTEETNVAESPPGGAKGEGPDNPQEDDRKSILAQPDQEFLDLVEATFNRIDQIELERTELNEKIKAEKAGLEDKGINNHAFKAVKAFRKLDEEQQENYDMSEQILRRAIKAPVQMELLDAQIARTH